MAGISSPSSPEPGVALVTGAGVRLGKAMALALGAQGWHIAVHCNRSVKDADATATEIISAGGRAFVLQADLAKEAETSALVHEARAEAGNPVTLLVNNASTYENDTARTHLREDWDRHMEVNLRAPVLLSQGFANALPAGQAGLIVNMIDQRVWKLNPQYFTYMLSKSALWTATRTLAQSLAPNIRVNAIGPGPTLKAAHQSAEQFERERAIRLPARVPVPMRLSAPCSILRRRHPSPAR